MNILSAEAGYSQEYNPTANPPQCNTIDCKRSIDTPVRLCQGRRACSISQEILIYPQGLVPALCSHQRDGNFIRIQFTCVIGAFSVKMFVLHCIIGLHSKYHIFHMQYSVLLKLLHNCLPSWVASPGSVLALMQPCCISQYVCLMCLFF